MKQIQQLFVDFLSHFAFVFVCLIYFFSYILVFLWDFICISCFLFNFVILLVAVLMKEKEQKSSIHRKVGIWEELGKDKNMLHKKYFNKKTICIIKFQHCLYNSTQRENITLLFKNVFLYCINGQLV